MALTAERMVAAEAMVDIGGTILQKRVEVLDHFTVGSFELVPVLVWIGKSST